MLMRSAADAYALRRRLFHVAVCFAMPPLPLRCFDYAPPRAMHYVCRYAERCAYMRDGAFFAGLFYACRAL